MIEIKPNEATAQGYTHNVLLEDIDIGVKVKFFDQTFEITKTDKGVFTGTSNYDDAPKNNKSGSETNGEHNLIFISQSEVWRVPIGSRYA